MQLPRCWLKTRGFLRYTYPGSATEGARLGRPDMGYLSREQMLGQARSIANAVNIPVIADMEGGYGTALHIEANIREFEAAGVAAVHIDDALAPAKCPFIPGVPPMQLISKDEMVGKVRRAAESRWDDNFQLIARCDMSSTASVRDSRESAIPADRVAEFEDRLRAYSDAGADLVFGMANTEHELKHLATLMPKPILTLMNPWLDLTVEDCENAGAAIVITSMSLLFVAMQSVRTALHKLQETGSLGSLREDMFPPDDYWRLMRTDQYPKLFSDFAIH